jgi:hypothetical protein
MDELEITEAMFAASRSLRNAVDLGWLVEED